MKLLRIQVNGLPLYKTPLDISFLAAQRVQNNHLNTVFHLFGNIYVNTAEAFIGINASGKTTVLKIISFVCLLLEAVPLNADFVPKILEEGTKTTFDIDFFANQKIYHLRSEVLKQKKADGNYDTQIISEKLWIKPVTTRLNKTNLFNFDDIQPLRSRNHDSNAEYLPDDVSIMIAVKKQAQLNMTVVNLTMLTNFNLFLPNIKNVPAEIISLLDPTIEHLLIERINDKLVARLQFFGRDELILYNIGDLNLYLSSGTVKGIRVFIDAIRVLKDGGYLLVDEIENHFNRELVASLLRLFMDQKTNPNGAVIIFSTHYSELLDEIERNDAIFIARNDSGLTIENLNSLLKRNDLKKSEVYQSDYLGGTAPKYEALLNLRKSIIKRLEE